MNSSPFQVFHGHMQYINFTQRILFLHNRQRGYLTRVSKKSGLDGGIFQFITYICFLIHKYKYTIKLQYNNSVPNGEGEGALA